MTRLSVCERFDFEVDLIDLSSSVDLTLAALIVAIIDELFFWLLCSLFDERLLQNGLLGLHGEYRILSRALVVIGAEFGSVGRTLPAVRLRVVLGEKSVQLGDGPLPGVVASAVSAFV